MPLRGVATPGTLPELFEQGAPPLAAPGADPSTSRTRDCTGHSPGLRPRGTPEHAPNAAPSSPRSIRSPPAGPARTGAAGDSPGACSPTCTRGHVDNRSSGTRARHRPMPRAPPRSWTPPAPCHTPCPPWNSPPRSPSSSPSWSVFDALDKRIPLLARLVVRVAHTRPCAATPDRPSAGLRRRMRPDLRLRRGTHHRIRIPPGADAVTRGTGRRLRRVVRRTPRKRSRPREGATLPEGGGFP